MKDIKVVVDKRTELMGIVLRLSKYAQKYPLLMREVKDWQYLQEVFAYFGKFKAHPAVKTLNKILSTGDFGYSIPLFLALQMDKEYDFHGQNSYPFVDELEGNKKVLEFLQQLKDFASESNFEEFYSSHIPYYKKEIANFKKQMNVDDVLVWMKEFYNDDFSNKEFYVNLALLFTNGGHGIQVDNKMYHVCSSSVDKNGQRQIWGCGYAAEKSETLHEFSHSIVNPLMDKYYSQIDLPDSKTLKEKSCGVYSGTPIYVIETIIRSLQNLYVLDKGDKIDGLNRGNQRQGFDAEVINAVTKKLDLYRQNPDRNFEKSFVDIANAVSKAVKTNNESEV